jgi:ATP-dependent helicase HepA
MFKIKASRFRQYAGLKQERWDLLVGREVTHEAFGPGVVSKIKADTFEVSIWITFSQPNVNPKERCFGPQAMDMIGEIEFPDEIGQRLPSDLPSGSQPPVSSSGKYSQTAHDVPPPTSPTPSPAFKPNQEVCLINNPNQRGRVIKPSVYASGEWNYEIYFSAEDVRTYKESALKLYAPTFQWGGLDDLLRDLALLKLRKPLGDALYALYASRTKFEVYQFKPAVKFLANPDQRLLIADEVGLGKTIEAGIIYVELQARIGLDRVLIVCPSGLRSKWHDEMKSRFDEEFTLLDTEGARRFLDQYRQYGSQVRLRGIIALESIRRRELAEAFSNVKLDMVIIDEAHHCRNTATLANAIASTLTENSDAVLLLTATPLQMGREDLFNLLAILSPGEFDNFQAFTDRLEPNQYVNRAAQMLSAGDVNGALKELKNVEKTSEKRRFLGNPYYQTVVDILKTPYPPQESLITAQRRLLELNTLASVFTRTRKRDIQEKIPKRTAFTLTVNFTPEEMDFYNQVLDEVRWNYENSHFSGAGSGWVTIMKERQVASCISAVMKKYDQYRPDPEEEDAFKKDFLSSNDPENDELESPVLPDISDLLGELYTRPKVCVPNIKTDSKFEVFWEALQEVLNDDPNSKVLIFSFFVGTIEHVQNELMKRGVKSRAIHGKYKVIDRQKTIEEFRDDPSIRVLVSSDVGSEGLDFQFCDTLFNYDLPWNPMKVEQRIGRIDRFGQESDRIRIYNLVIEDTIESRILIRLYDRIEIFKQSIGDIEVILGDQIRELTQAVFSRKLSKEEEIQRAETAAKNILRQKQEMEEFEQKKLQFLGQEAIFNTTIERTIDSGRFVSDVEVHALVDGYLKEKFQLSRLEANGAGDATYTLCANNDLVEEVKAFIFKQRKNDLTAQQFLPKLSPGKEIPLTFSHELAYQRKLLEFITPRHPLAMAALEYWKQKSIGTKRLIRLRIKTEIAPAGIYFFFIFTIDSEGIDKDSRLIPVVISTKNGDVHNDLSKQFLRLIQTNAEPLEILSGQCDESEFENAEHDALLHITHIRDNLYRELLASNEAIINARLSAVEQSFKAKRKRIQGILEKVDNASIRRMHESQLRNLDAKKKAKDSEIEKSRNVDVSFSPQMRGYVEVIQNA